METNEAFWQMVDTLVERSKIVIDRPRGSSHPRYPGWIYPVDYGYLEDTSSMDGGGIDIWVGTDPGRAVRAILCTVDLFKKDSEIKILIGCTQEEVQRIYDLHNESESMKGILIPRGRSAPAKTG